MIIQIRHVFLLLTLCFFVSGSFVTFKNYSHFDRNSLDNSFEAFQLDFKDKGIETFGSRRFRRFAGSFSNPVSHFLACEWFDEAYFITGILLLASNIVINR